MKILVVVGEGGGMSYMHNMVDKLVDHGIEVTVKTLNDFDPIEGKSLDFVIVDELSHMLEQDAKRIEELLTFDAPLIRKQMVYESRPIRPEKKYWDKRRW